MHFISTRGAVLAVLALMAIALAGGLGWTSANRAANRRLAVFLLVMAGVGLAYAVDLSRLDRTWGWMRHLPLAVPLALGPLLHAYLHRLVRGRPMSRAWLHALPAAAQLAYVVAVFLLPRSVQDVLYDGRGRDRLEPLFQLALPVSLAIYAVMSLRLLGEYRRWVVQTRSDADLFAGRWVANILLLLLITLAGEAAIRLLVISGRRVDLFDVYPFHIWLLVMGVYLGVEGRRYVDRRFPAMEAVAVEGSSGPEPAEKDWAAMGAAWRDRTAAEEWWREPGLSLPVLARRLGTNTAYLSRALNDGLGVNFSEMINALRAEAVARALDRGEVGAGDLLDAAFDAGFSSKTSFNRAFRQRYGVSPSRYRAPDEPDPENLKA